MADQPNNPLHGKTLEMILNELVAHYGWPELVTASASIAFCLILPSVQA